MAVFQWVILCERAVIEEGAKTISLVSILENVQLPTPPRELTKPGQAVPLVPLRFFVVQQWSRSKPRVGERVPGRVRLVGPKKEFSAQEFVVDLTGSERARVISQTIGFPLQGPGLYRCIIEAKLKMKWKTVGGTEFSVAYVDGGAARRH
jgi:hypothetical protein